MKKLEDMARPISESSIDLVRPDAKNESNVDVEFCDNRLIIKYQEDIMVINRDVLQNIMSIVEDHDDEVIRKANEKEKLITREKTISIINNTRPRLIKGGYTKEIVCDMLEEWEFLSDWHKLGLMNYCKVIFSLSEIDIEDIAIREAMFNNIVLC